MRMCGAHRFISSACVVLFVIEREWPQSEPRAVFLGADMDMHIMRAAHLNIGANDDDRGIHQNRLARRRFALPSFRALLRGLISLNKGSARATDVFPLMSDCQMSESFCQILFEIAPM